MDNVASVGNDNGSAAEGRRKRLITAIEEVGAYDRGDVDLDLQKHCKRLQESAPALAALLKSDRDLRDTAEQYRTFDMAARRAKRNYERMMYASFVLAPMLFFAIVWLLLTPGDYVEVARFPAYFASSVILSALVAIVWLRLAGASSREALPGAPMTSRDNAIPQGSRSNQVWAGTAIAGLVIFRLLVVWDPLAEFMRQPGYLTLLAVVVLGVAMLAADAASGGQVAKGLGFKSWREDWFEKRGRAEHVRRQFFRSIVTAGEKQADSAAVKGDAIAHKLPCLVVEYLWRFHIEAQQHFYREKANKFRKDPWWAGTMTWMVVISLICFGLAALASLVVAYSEQSSSVRWFWKGPDGLSALSLQYSIEGSEDWAFLIGLFLLSVFLGLRAFVAFVDRERNARRYGYGLSRLSRATSFDPSHPQFVAPLRDPLQSAREAAARGDWSRIHALCSDVNLLLAADMCDWSGEMTFTIERIGKIRVVPRLTSIRQLSADKDFPAICEEMKLLGYEPFKAEKVGYVSARRVERDEQVKTSFEGVKTVNTAEAGQWIVVNMDKQFRRFKMGEPNINRYLIGDLEGNFDTYVIKHDKFVATYEKTEHETLFGAVYKAKTRSDPVVAIQFEAGFSIVAPWDDIQARTKGYLVRNGNDVYGVYEPIFEKTYDVVPD